MEYPNSLAKLLKHLTKSRFEMQMYFALSVRLSRLTRGGYSVTYSNSTHHKNSYTQLKDLSSHCNQRTSSSTKPHPLALLPLSTLRTETARRPCNTRPRARSSAAVCAYVRELSHVPLHERELSHVPLHDPVFPLKKIIPQKSLS
jgi:hypothetical protein